MVVKLSTQICNLFSKITKNNWRIMKTFNPLKFLILNPNEIVGWNKYFFQITVLLHNTKQMSHFRTAILSADDYTSIR